MVSRCNIRHIRFLRHTAQDHLESRLAPYRLGVGTTGVIFAAIAIAWLAYLVPHFVRRGDDEELLEDSDPADRFSDSMRIVRHGTAPLLDQDLEEIESFEVSTPQTRRAAVKDPPAERLAASRRRRVLLVLMVALSAMIGLCGAHLIPWWSAAIPGGLLLIFIVVARISVRVMLRGLDARYREIRHGSNESTIFLSRKDFADGRMAPSASGTADVAASLEPCGIRFRSPCRPMSPSRWRPERFAPSTCRACGVSSSARHDWPVTADAPESASDSAEPATKAAKRAGLPLPDGGKVSC